MKWCMPTIPALRNVRLKEFWFKANSRDIGLAMMA